MRRACRRAAGLLRFARNDGIVSGFGMREDDGFGSDDHSVTPPTPDTPATHLPAA
jgi:hypothetical protein